MINFKALTLELYNQDVKVTFKPGTDCYTKYGHSLEGKLVGRIWGERFDANAPVSIVMGIMIQTASDEINLTCNEIENIERLI